MEESVSMGPFDDLAKTVVSNVTNAVFLLDSAFGKHRWGMEMAYMSPHWHVATIHVNLTANPHDDAVMVLRSGWSDEGPDRAFLEAYRNIGGRVPVEEEPKQTPKPARGRAQVTPAAQSRHISGYIPSPYSGPVPYNDSNTDIKPCIFPDPPTEPEWFKDKIGGYGAKKSGGTWTKDLTWGEAVQIELANPGGRDQPLNYIQWRIGNHEPPEDPKYKTHWINFISRGKAAAIWTMLSIQQHQEEELAEAMDETPL